MEDRMLTAKCRQLIGEYEDVFERILRDLNSIEDSRPNTGKDAFEMASQVMEQRGYKRGLKELIGRIKHYAGK